MDRTIFAAGIAAAMFFSAQVSATVYQYDITNPPGSDGAGDVASFSASYDDVNEILSWSSTIDMAAGNLADGFWLVMSDGPNPKNNTNEYAIFYGDGISGNLTSYVYNGVNSANSWSSPGEFIEGFAGGLTYDTSVADQVTFSFSITTTFINSYIPTNGDPNEWDGAMFGNLIGIWYHPTVLGGAPTYNPDGSLGSFPIAASGWYDTSDRPTTVVPVPAALWLFGTGLLGLTGIARRKA